MKKRLLRNPINENILIDILEDIPSRTFSGRRAIICIILLYITGCRINELRNFNLPTIVELSRDGTVIINSYKTNNMRRIDISDSEKQLLLNHMNIVYDYYNNLKITDHILMSSKGKSINNRSAYIWLNKILKKYGKKHGLNILSHSFRINYVTELIKNYNVNIAQTIVGHKYIGTTIRYDRNVLTSKEVKNIRNNINTVSKLNHIKNKSS